MADIWDKVKSGDIKPGDHIKTTAKFFSDATVTHEGDVESINIDGGVTYAQLVGVPCVPWTQEELDAVDTIEIYRLRPQVKLPTAAGSAVLVYSPFYLENVVLVRLAGHAGWTNPRNGEDWDSGNVEANFIRVLFDAGA